MPDQSRTVTLIVIGCYNLVQNFLIPAAAYVPANLATAAGLVALARRYGCTWDALGLEPKKSGAGWRSGAAGVMTVAIVTVLVARSPRLRGYFLDHRAADQRGGEKLYRTLVRYPLGTALFEEVAFRGVVEGMWRRSGGTRREASLTAAISFGIWHLIPARRALAGNPLGDRFGSEGPRLALVAGGALLAGLGSLGFSWLRERSQSLIAPIMLHAAINGAGYLAGVAAWRRSGRPPLMSF